LTILYGAKPSLPGDINNIHGEKLTISTIS
jgi:hypothetical protein